MRNFKINFLSNYFRKQGINKLLSEYNIKNNWAIVTGCTSGIGKSYSEILVRHGMNMILIARNEEKLKFLQENLKSINENVETMIIVWDFSKEEIYSNINLEKYLDLFSKINIRLLINNVGESSLGGDFIREDLNKTKSMINVNILSNIFMTKLFVRSQEIYNKTLVNHEQNSKHGIINISSYFGTRPVPGVTTYSSSKAFITNLSECLMYELPSSKERNFKIICLNPLFVRTNMVRKWKDSSLLVEPDDLVYCSFRKLGRNRLKVKSYGNWKHSFQAYVLKLIPNYIFSSYIYAFYKKQYEKLISRRKRH